MSESARMTAYINPKTSEQFRAVGDYTLADGSPAVNFVCIFAANYASSELPYLRANNNQPPTSNPFNENIQAVLEDGSIKYLQDKGLKVLLTVGNGWSSVGWSQFTSESAASDFANYLKSEVVGKYGLDGIDIDDEYSTGPPIATSLAMVTTEMEAIMPDKTLSKALFSDLGYFEATWNGHTLAENLNFGWEMSYGGGASSRLEPYTTIGMSKDKLSLGFWANQPSADPAKDIDWLKTNGYGGAMVFGFEEQQNIDLMGYLVNAWYGQGNWNPPAS